MFKLGIRPACLRYAAHSAGAMHVRNFRHHMQVSFFTITAVQAAIGTTTLEHIRVQGCPATVRLEHIRDQGVR